MVALPSHRPLSLLLSMIAVAALSTSHRNAGTSADLGALLDHLDTDADGRVTPYEGAESFLRLVEEGDEDGDGALTHEELEALLVRVEEEIIADAEEWIATGDEDGDGRLSLAEAKGDAGMLAEQADRDGDGFLTSDEIRDALPRNLAELIAMETGAMIAELDADGDGALTRDELADDDPELVGEADQDGDGRASHAELTALFIAEEPVVEFRVRGHVAEMTGTIDGSTPGKVLELIVEHPDVDTIEMIDVPGSMDDEANLRAALLVREHGFTTRIGADGEIASGGTDFFLAGAIRIVEPGARIGVHSWGGGPVEATALPRDHESHELYLEFYRAIDIPEDFYWFTLEAAPPDDIHWMTPNEIVRYRVDSR